MRPLCTPSLGLMGIMTSALLRASGGAYAPVMRLRAPSTCGGTCPPPEVYVLELVHGRVYVGKTSDLHARLKQHRRGDGASFTKTYPPTGRTLPRLGSLRGPGDGPERDETLRQMDLRGVDMVRGWKYCKDAISEQDRANIESDMRELFDLCRRCGRSTHFASRCKYVLDRHGHPIVSHRSEADVLDRHVHPIVSHQE